MTLRVTDRDTLSHVLLELGYTHVPANFGARTIYRGTEAVFTGTCFETWKWLRREGLVAA